MKTEHTPSKFKLQTKSLEAQVAGIKFEKQMPHEWDLPTKQDSGTEDIKKVQTCPGNNRATAEYYAENNGSYSAKEDIQNVSTEAAKQYKKNIT